MKVKFTANVFAGGNEYKAEEVYELDKKTYEWLKEYCEPIEEEKAVEEPTEDKMIKKAKNK